MLPSVCGAGRRSGAEFFAGRLSGRWLRSFRQPHPEHSERRRPFPEPNFRASAFPRSSGQLPARASGERSRPGRSEPPASAFRASGRAFPVPRTREAPGVSASALRASAKRPSGPNFRASASRLPSGRAPAPRACVPGFPGPRPRAIGQALPAHVRNRSPHPRRSADRRAFPARAPLTRAGPSSRAS